MKKLFLPIAFLCILGCGQTASNGITGITTGPAIITGGQVSIPTPSNNQLFVHVAGNGMAFLLNIGPTTNANAGLWTANAAACEVSPSTCKWTPLQAGEPATNGNYTELHEMVDIDSTHEIIISGFNGNAGACTNCTLQILNTSSGSYTPVTLPSLPTGQSPVCMARDSSGIFYTATNYGGHIWKSTDNTGTAFTLASADYTKLAGVSPNSGNIYTCKVFGSRIYFGGEGGLISCDLAFTLCSNDYLPFTAASGQRDFTALLSDVDSGGSATPTTMVECCRQNINVLNYAPVSRFSGGTWTQLTTASGIPQFAQGVYFEADNLARGTGTSRRYYLLLFGSTPPAFVEASTDSTGATWQAFSPSLWPASSSTYQPRQLALDTSSNAMWTVFEGSSGAGLYITP
jgi:hypothetical protein